MTKLAIIELPTKRFKNMKKQAGFTLIELIMVIVILGILSAFALPRFADLSGSAATAAVEGARASAASSNAIVHAASLAAGNNAVASGVTVAVEGGNAELAFGYPVIAATGANLDIFEVAQLDGFLSSANATDTVLFVYQTLADGADCFAFSIATSATAPATVSSVGVLDLTVAGTATALDATDTCGTVAF